MTSSWLAGSTNQRSIRIASSMKSFMASRFLSRNALRAVHATNCEGPIASLLVNSGCATRPEFGIERERQTPSLFWQAPAAL